MKVLFNGRLIERSECAVDIEDRGYQFGDGVYEVIRIYNGILFTLDEHIARLYKSAAEIGIDLSFSEAELKSQLKRARRHQSDAGRRAVSSSDKGKSSEEASIRSRAYASGDGLYISYSEA